MSRSTIRPIAAADHDLARQVGELTVDAYRTAGLLVGAPDDGGPGSLGNDVSVLRDVLGRTTEVGSKVLAALSPAGTPVGGVTLLSSASTRAQFAREGELEIRFLAVAPAAQGAGVARALLQDCADRAVHAGASRIVLGTVASNLRASRLYLNLGFIRVAARDIQLPSELVLEAYEFALETTYCTVCGEPTERGGHDRCRSIRSLEPPRWCPACRRRMSVQVLPTGWTSRCVEHGTRDSGQLQVHALLR